MRFVVGSPEEHSVLGNIDNNNIVDDDALATICSCPVRRGSSWLVAAVTKRMYFLVFAAEKVWSRKIIGKLPIAIGAVTEGCESSIHHPSSHKHENENSPTQQQQKNSPEKSSSIRHQNGSNDSLSSVHLIRQSVTTNNDNNSNKNNSSSSTSKTKNKNLDHQQEQEQEEEDNSLLRLVETPISAHFHHRGQRIVIATTVRRLLILELDAEMGQDTTPLSHVLDTSTRSLTCPLGDFSSRWCVSCETFLPQGLVQSVDTAGCVVGNVFTVASTSGHIFVVSWQNGAVLYELPLNFVSKPIFSSSSSNSNTSFSSSGLITTTPTISPSPSHHRRYINTLTFSTRLRLAAISFVDGEIGIFCPILSSSSNNNNNDNKVGEEENDFTGGARIPLDLSQRESQLKLIGIYSSSSSSSSSSSNTSSTQQDSASVAQFLAFNNKHRALISCGSRISSLKVVGLSDVVNGNKNKKKNESNIIFPSSFNSFASSVRNTLVDIASSSSSSSSASFHSTTSSSSQNLTFSQLGLGELTSVKWSPDEDCLVLSFSDSGVCVFHIGGSLVFHSWRQQQQFSSSNNNAISDFHNNNPAQDSNSSGNCNWRNILPKGCLNSLFLDNRRIIAVNRCGTILTQIEMAIATPETTSAINETDGTALLVGLDELWQFRPRLSANNNAGGGTNNNSSSSSGFQVLPSSSAAKSQAFAAMRDDEEDDASITSRFSSSRFGGGDDTSWERLRVPASFFLFSFIFLSL